MKVLIIGSDTPAGTSLQAMLAHWGRHEPVLLTTAASRWRSERQAKKAARKEKPDAVVDLRIAWQVAAGDVPAPEDVERAHWLAKACEHSHIHYLLLSSDQVFSGAGSRSLRESDPSDTCTEPGLQLVEVEGRVLLASPSAIILRTGPLFSSADNNLLTRVLRRMTDERHAVFDDRHIFCPVATDDIARVLSAILDQLSAGAVAQGVYHYSSGDRSTEYGFAEVALAAASQYSDCGDVLISAQLHENDHGGEARVFDCSRLRDSFAIKQVPWRGFLNTVVKQYASQSAEQNAEQNAAKKKGA